ncbi:MAG: type IV secretion system DNA-binding domain-containing protein [Patescibacteria group bacterium]
MKEHITTIGETVFRGESRRFGIKDDDRRRHVYVLGKTGVGKSTLLENMIIDDIKAGYGVAFLDPHGGSAETILNFIPEERLDDVIYIDPSDTEFPISFNPLEEVSPDFRHLVASSMMGVFKKIWADAWSARMQYILNNALLALLEYPGTTLLGIQRMLNNPEYRKEIVSNLKDPVVKSFWVDEFAKYSQRFESEATAAIQNKVGQFISNPLIRNILGQAHSTIDMRKIMDEGKILIANLSKGKVGEDNSALLGAMIITKLQLAAMSRVNVPEEERRDFYLYVDEFQNFATESFVNVLSEARKYRLSLILANQYLDQLDHEGSYAVRSAIFGNVGTMAIFRIGAKDAEFVEKEFNPEYDINDLVNLAKYHIYIKLMIDGLASRPFAAKTLAPPTPSAENFIDVIIENTRSRYAIPKSTVEEKIAREWLSTSEKTSTDRAARREEKPLREVLTPRHSDYPQRHPEPQSSLTRRSEGSFRRPSPPRPPHSHFDRSGEILSTPPPRHPEKPNLRPQTPRPPKQSVDIAALRSALEGALKKDK